MGCLIWHPILFMIIKSSISVLSIVRDIGVGKREGMIDDY